MMSEVGSLSWREAAIRALEGAGSLTAEEIVARIEEAYLNLNARYEIAYQTLSREARELKIRIQCPSGWGETSVAIPAPAAG